MTVKDRVGRNRYIAFVVSPPVEKARLLAALRVATDPPWLVEYRGGRGLGRCAHGGKETTIAFLNAMGVGDFSRGTKGRSGTIREAREKILGPARRPGDSTK